MGHLQIHKFFSSLWATHFRAPMLLALQGPGWVDGWVSVVLRVHGVCACA